MFISLDFYSGCSQKTKATYMQLDAFVLLTYSWSHFIRIKSTVYPCFVKRQSQRICIAAKQGLYVQFPVAAGMSSRAKCIQKDKPSSCFRDNVKRGLYVDFGICYGISRICSSEKFEGFGSMFYVQCLLSLRFLNLKRAWITQHILEFSFFFL